jgi:WD40 repeat protein
LVHVGFILPWYASDTLPWYFSYHSSQEAASGLQMWLGGRSIDLAFAPGIQPDFFAYLWLLPGAAFLVGLLGICNFISRKRNTQWLRLCRDVVFLLLMSIFLYPVVISHMTKQIGFWICFIGWLLMLLSVGLDGAFWRWDLSTNAVIEQNERRMVISGLIGLVGLFDLSVGGFLFWKNWQSHTSIATTYMSQVSGRNVQNVDSILSVDWSPKGNRILVGRLHGPSQSWDAFTTANIRTYQPVRVTAGAWSPDGKHIALADLVSSYERTPIVISSTTGIQEAAAPFSTQDGTMSVQAMAWSSDSQSIAVAGPISAVNPGAFSVQIWHPFTGQVSRGYIVPVGAGQEVIRVGTIAWSPDGKHLAAYYFGLFSNQTNEVNDTVSGVFVWETHNGTVIGKYETNHYPLLEGPNGYGGKFLSWSPDSRFLAVVNQTEIQIIDANSQRIFTTYHGHVSQVQALAYSPDGQYIASGGYDWTVQVWESATGVLRFLYQGHTGVVRDLAWSPNGKDIVSCGDDGTVQVWIPE